MSSLRCAQSKRGGGGYVFPVLSVFFALALILGAPVPAFSSAGAGENPSEPVAQHAASTGDALIELAVSFPRLAKPTVQLVVDISVNREAKGDFFAEIDDEGGLYFKAEDLLALMLKFDQGRTVLIGDEPCAPLSALREVSVTFDEKNLTVAILGKTTETKKTSLELYSLQPQPQNVYHPRETSAFLNYALSYSHADPAGFQSFTAANKIGARSGDVFFVSDSLYRKTETEKQFVRLSTNATYERRGDLQWLVLGDQLANSGDLGSTVNMGGAGFSKLYRLDPYYITQPLFTLRGAAEFPSDAEIYLDGRLAGRHSVAPGSFELKNIYSTAGSHLVEVALKDPFGNEQRISYPLYFSAQLLREGLHEYSYNAGFLREQFGVESNEYGKAAFSAFHRYGVTSALNIGARAEGSSGIANAGIFTSFALPRAGAFTLSLAGSEADGNRGAAGSLQHSYQFKSFNTSMFLRGFSRHYATVVAPAATDTARYAASANVGFQVVPAGSFSLAYSAAETHGGARTRVASANYTRVISRTMSVFATASRTKAQETTNSFFLGLNFSFDQNLRGSVQASRSSGTNSETVQLQKDIPVGEGLGYRASLNRSETGASTAYAFNPSLQYNARYGIYSLDSIVQSSDSGTTEAYNISAAGSFVYAGGFYGFSRPVSDSFGIVTIDNVPDAVVLNNGAEMGKTGPSGALVVPSLASYSQNQITLDVKNLPMDYTVSGVNVKISPSIWSGSCVAFDVQKVRAVTGILYVPQKDGQKMPLEYVDILMKAGESEVTIPTGKHGEFYAENILPDGPGTAVVDRQSCRAVAERRKSGGGAIPSGNYHARVHFEGKTCEFTIGFPITDDAITDIGEIQCVVRE